MSFSWGAPSIHVATIVLCLGLLAWYHEATRVPGSEATRRQRIVFWFGVGFLFVALSWPVADLAQHTSLLLIVFQRQLLVLGAAPCLLFGTPMAVTARLTRPPAIDAVASRLSRPVPALATTTVLLFATAIPPSISAASSSTLVRTFLVVLTMVAGITLWLPVIVRVPGNPHLSDIAKAGYLVAQSLAPTFLSFAWIFARRPLYSSLTGQHRVLGFSAMSDQQLSAYLSKLLTFGILWTVAYVLFARAADGDDDAADDPLHWVDVQRSLERLDRHERRAGISPGQREAGAAEDSGSPDQ